MLVRALECRDFRNLAGTETGLGPGLTVLHGPNAAGKTNLLEALYFGLTAHSFRAGSDRDAIRFDRRSARVELTLAESTRDARLLAAIDRGGERRHLLDGRPLVRSDERPLVSVFHPDRLQLLKGPPAHRRAHLDRFLSALWPSRADLRARFGRTLAQRNALVSRVRAGLGAVDLLATWDERLAAEAEPLIAARVEAAGALAAPFRCRAEALGLEEAALAYRPRTDGDAGTIAAELERLRSHELGRSYVTFGPQLDELLFTSGNRPLRRFGSQGQQRTALLALLFAERDALLAAGRAPPLLLLDDVMSELDPAHRELLVDSFAETGQVLVTATELGQVPAAAAAGIAVDGGATRALAAAA